MKVFIDCFSVFFRAFRRLFCHLSKCRFKKCGRNVIFSPWDRFSYETISIGSDVYIGPCAIFRASDSAITIGNKVMFGPRVTIMGGDHNFSVVGRCMFDVKEKTEDDDLPVYISDDVWVGACVTILKGVKIGRGAIVAAGALVIHDVPEYSIVGGVPAKVMRYRFSESEVFEHEKALGDI